MEMIGIKCEPRDTKLLGKFFARMASEVNNDDHNGIFIPKGVAYLLGPKMYKQVLQETISFYQPWQQSQ